MPGTKHDDYCTALLNYVLNSDDGGLTGAQHYIGLLVSETALDYEADDPSVAGEGQELDATTEPEYASRVALPSFANWTLTAEQTSGAGVQAVNNNAISVVSTAESAYTIYGWFITDASSLASAGNIRYTCNLTTPITAVVGDALQFSAGALKIVEN